jgi:serine/threonine protein kinase
MALLFNPKEDDEDEEDENEEDGPLLTLSLENLGIFDDEELKKVLSREDYANVLKKLPKNCDKSKKIAFSECLNNTSGSQGTLYYNCPSIKNKAVKQTKMQKYSRVHGDEIGRGALDDLEMFSTVCQVHEKLKKLDLINLVTIHDCWYCSSDDEHPENAFVNILQDYIGDSTSLENYIDSSVHGAIKMRNLLGIIIQVIGTIQQLCENNLFHNDLHIGNIILVPFSLIGRPIINYNIGGFKFPISSEWNDWLVKIIDYGYMTEGYNLDSKYRRSLLAPSASLDICQFFLGFIDISVDMPEFNDIFSTTCNKGIHKTAREEANLKFSKLPFHELGAKLLKLYNKII